MTDVYFTATALIFALLSTLYLISGFALGQSASPFVLWMSAGTISALCVVASPAAARGLGFIAGDRTRFMIAAAAKCVLVCFIGCVLIAGHRLYVVPVVLAQAVLVERYLRRFVCDDRARYIAVGIAGFLTWICSVELVWTPLNDWLMSGSAATGLSALAFGASFMLVLGQVLSEEAASFPASRWYRVAEMSIAGFVFFELAFRTDHLSFDFIPYHRSYWAGPADFLRAGHWLLWDVPTQYGFLSELAVAFTPGRNAWQSLYVLTGIVLVLEAMLLYVVLRRNGGGFANYCYSVALPCAVLFSSEATRFPFGARLYPQQGLRFVWPMLALFALYMRYMHRDCSEIARRWFIVGWIAWALGLAWSFETGVWTTLIWVGYLVTEQAVRLIEGDVWTSVLASCFIRRILPCLIIPLGLFGVVDGYYFARLGRFPDWSSFIEFSEAYANADVQSPPFNAFGPGLIVVLLLSGIATYGIVFALRKRFAALPVVAASLAAVWGTSIYYVGEPFNQHVNALLEVFALVFAVLFAVEREERIANASLLFARLAVVPTFILVIATAFGEPGRISTISVPFMPGFSFNGTRDFPAVRGEVAALMHRAGIKPDDPVNFPNSPAWNKVDTGLIMPFSREADGTLHEYPTWLPMSPVGPWNTLYTLPLDRRRLYIERFLALDRRHGGWLIMYHNQADCKEISPTLRNVRTLAGTNFSATLCANQGE